MMSDRRHMTAQEFIFSLVEDGVSMDPWPKKSFENDFILISEFSELVGPKPVETIPKKNAGDFNINSFSVRIMSVDCVSIMHASEGEEFNIAGDTEVVLTELSEGAIAYVHHFVLYDIRARGFVRPYCIAYVSSSYVELMRIYRTVRELVAAVTLLFRFGNMMSFINDLNERYYYLVALRNTLSDHSQEILVDNVPLTLPQKRAISAESVDENIVNIVEICKKFREYSCHDCFEEHRSVFASRFTDVFQKTNLCEMQDVALAVPNINARKDTHGDVPASPIQKQPTNEVTDMRSSDSNIDQETMDGGHFCEDLINENDEILLTSPTKSLSVPSDVIASLLGKKYDKSLRSLEELCDVTYETGFEILKLCVKHFQNVPSDLSDTLVGRSGYLRIGAWEFDMASPVVSNLYCPKRRQLLSNKSVREMPPLYASNIHTSSDQSKIELDLNKASLSRDVSSLRGQSAEGILPDSLYLKPSSYLPQKPHNSFLSYLQYSDLSTPLCDSYSHKPSFPSIGSFVNIPYRKYEPLDEFIVLESPSSELFSAGSSSGVTPTTSSSPDSYQDAVEGPQPDSPRKIVSSTSVEGSSINTPILSPPSYFRNSSVISNNSTWSSMSLHIKHAQLSLQTLKRRFTFLPHLVYSLLVGRPVVIIAEEINMSSVSKIVYCLANFVPSASESGLHRVVPFMKGVLHLSSLGSISLAGVVKSKNQNVVPNSLKPYLTLFDYEKKLLLAPPYNGVYLNDLFAAQKSFASEISFREYVQQVLQELCSLAYVRFAIMYGQLRGTGANIGKYKSSFGGHAYDVLVTELHTFQGNFQPGDLHIVQYLARLLKEQVLDTVAANLSDENSELALPADVLFRMPVNKGVRLSTLKTCTFQNTEKKKK